MPGSVISDKWPALTKYKVLLLFLFKALGIFLILLVLKFIHRTLLDPSSDLWISSFFRELNIYALMSDSIVYPAKWILSSAGYETHVSGFTIWITGGRSIIMHAPCMGLNIMGVFAALIIAYPSRVKVKIKLGYILAGIGGIHLLNVLRVAVLTLKNKYNFELIVDHHDLFNILIYAFVFALFYTWIKYSGKSVDLAAE